MRGRKIISMTRGFAGIVGLLVALAIGTDATAAVVRHSQVQAERNILHAHRFLRRLDARLVDARTGLPHTDSVTCRGRGRNVGARWPRFVCTISYQRVHVVVRYYAQTGNGFEVHRLPRTG